MKMGLQLLNQSIHADLTQISIQIDRIQLKQENLLNKISSLDPVIDRVKMLTEQLYSIKQTQKAIKMHEKSMKINKDYCPVAQSKIKSLFSSLEDLGNQIIKTLNGLKLRIFG